MALVQLLLLLFPNVFCVCFHFHVFKDKAEKTLKKRQKTKVCWKDMWFLFWDFYRLFSQLGTVTCALQGKHHNLINSEENEPKEPPLFPLV